MRRRLKPKDAVRHAKSRLLGQVGAFAFGDKVEIDREAYSPNYIAVDAWIESNWQVWVLAIDTTSLYTISGRPIYHRNGPFGERNEDLPTGTGWWIPIHSVKRIVIYEDPACPTTVEEFSKLDHRDTGMGMSSHILPHHEEPDERADLSPTEDSPA